MRAQFRSLVLAACMGIPAIGIELFPLVLETFDYPVLGTQAQIAGDVGLDVTVRSTGEVTETKVVSGHRVLAGAAEAAIKKWRFGYMCPERGAPTQATVRFRFTFKLQGVVHSRPRTRVIYAFPNHVTVVGESVHYQPAELKVKPTTRQRVPVPGGC